MKVANKLQHDRSELKWPIGRSLVGRSLRPMIVTNLLRTLKMKKGSSELRKVKREKFLSVRSGFP